MKENKNEIRSARDMDEEAQKQSVGILIDEQLREEGIKIMSDKRIVLMKRVMKNIVSQMRDMDKKVVVRTASERKLQFDFFFEKEKKPDWIFYKDRLVRFTHRFQKKICKRKGITKIHFLETKQDEVESADKLYN